MSDCGPADNGDTNDEQQPDGEGALVEPSQPSRADLVAAVKAVMVDAGIDLDEPTAQSIISVVQTARSYSGPIADPNSLAQHDAVFPGLSREIIDAWHEQRRHRMRLEANATEGSGDRIDRSQRNSMIVAVVGLLVAGAAGIWGGWGAAAVIALISVGGPNAATILARFIKPGD